MLFPDSSLGHFFFLIAGIHITTKRVFEKELKEHGLTFAQFGTLVALSRKSEISQKELSDMLDTDTTNIMVICEGLEKKGFIKRSPNPEDRRAYLLTVTPRGRARLLKTMPLMSAHLLKLNRRISKQETKAALPALEQFYDYVKELDRRRP